MEIIKRHIPKNLKSYTNIILMPKYITIHETETGTEDIDKNSNVDYYYNLLLSPKEGREEVGYHYIVDDKNIYEFIEPNIVAFHCGNKEGNYNSIGIERCVYSGINHLDAINLQAKITAYLMKKYNIPLTNVRTHKSWSGKECPSRLLNNTVMSFNDFLNLVKSYYERMK